MRVFALLFAFYFTVLGGMACPEVEVCAGPPQSAVLQAFPREGGNLPGGVGDWCSPLCQCHCCPGFAVPAGLPLTFGIRPDTKYLARRFGARPGPAVPARAPAAPWKPPQGA